MEVTTIANPVQPRFCAKTAEPIELAGDPLNQKTGSNQTVSNPEGCIGTKGQLELRWTIFRVELNPGQFRVLEGTQQR